MPRTNAEMSTLQIINELLDSRVHTVESLRGKKLFEIFDRPISETFADRLKKTLDAIPNLRVRGEHHNSLLTKDAHPRIIEGKITRIDYSVMSSPKILVYISDERGMYLCDAESIVFI
jgi:hypothetical protein